MTDVPAFSVVMAAHNASETIDASIRSVCGQTRSDWELIVVDDGSTDDTSQRVESYVDSGRVRLIRQGNQGPAGARNAGIRVMRGRFLSVLDSDDLWMPEYLEVMGETMERRPDAGMAYTDAWVLHDETSRVLRTTAMEGCSPPLPPPRDPLDFFQELLKRNFVFVSVTVRRTVLDAVGGYEPSLRGTEDYEFSLRTAAARFPVVRAPGLLAVYRIRRGSLSSDRVRLAESVRDVYRLAAGYELPPAALRAVHARLELAEHDVEALQGGRLSRALALIREEVKRKRTSLLWRRYAYADAPEAVSALLAAAQPAAQRLQQSRSRRYRERS